jgi:hypothetical protein
MPIAGHRPTGPLAIFRTRRRKPRALGGAAVVLAAFVAIWSYYDAPARNIASLVDPEKLATLRADRAANGRLLKCLYWMEAGRERGQQPESVAKSAIGRVYGEGPRADLVRRSLLRNYQIAGTLGCLTAANLQRLRRGESPRIALGPYAGQEAEVDHVVPVAIAPQWENEIANLELLPRTLNRRKGATIGKEQESFARELRAVGL